MDCIYSAHAIPRTVFGAPQVGKWNEDAPPDIQRALEDIFAFERFYTGTTGVYPREIEDKRRHVRMYYLARAASAAENEAGTSTAATGEWRPARGGTPPSTRQTPRARSPVERSHAWRSGGGARAGGSTRSYAPGMRTHPGCMPGPRQGTPMSDWHDARECLPDPPTGPHWTSGGSHARESAALRNAVCILQERFRATPRDTPTVGEVRFLTDAFDEVMNLNPARSCRDWYNANCCCLPGMSYDTLTRKKKELSRYMSGVVDGRDYYSTLRNAKNASPSGVNNNASLVLGRPGDPS
eukprot:g20979.t1